MAHTDARSQWLDRGTARWSGILPICLLLLPYPYSMFAGIIGFFFLCLWQTYFYPKAVGRRLYRSGFLLLGGWLIISAGFAQFPGEAFLQLTHFIPFIWFWAALTLYLQQTNRVWQQLHQWAMILVLTTVPLNLIGIFEYVLKLTRAPDSLTQFPVLDWLYLGDLHIPRAFSLFDYPNTLASFLVMTLGLNLGLVFIRYREGPFQPPWRGLRAILVVNILLTLGCLYCSGSRNGYLVAAIALLVTLFSIRTQRWLRSLSLVGLVAIVVTTLRFGLAGRELSAAWLTDDPRVQVWGLALSMIRDRPLVGYGLGNYKLIYDGEVPGYVYIAHAHNFWLTLAAEAGLPAAILFTVIVGCICWQGGQALIRLRCKAYANHYALLLGYALSFGGIVLFSLFDVTLFEARVNLLAWLSLGVIAASAQLSQAMMSAPLDQLDGAEAEVQHHGSGKPTPEQNNECDRSANAHSDISYKQQNG